MHTAASPVRCGNRSASFLPSPGCSTTERGSLYHTCLRRRGAEGDDVERGERRDRATSPFCSSTSFSPTPGAGSTIQNAVMKRDMIFDKGRDEVVTVVISLM